MKLFRFGDHGREKLGAVRPDGSLGDASGIGLDLDAELIGKGPDALKRALAGIAMPALDSRVRVGCCIANPSKIVCVGLNYKRHVLESGNQMPIEPALFLKAPSSLSGPNDDVIIPKNSTKTDYEVEFCVVIGKRALHVEEHSAMDYVFGYCQHNDYSEREFQLERGGQWVKGKSCDTFAPLGPFLVTKDEIPDPHALRLTLKVNGETRQDSNTSDLIFNIPFLVSYVSQFMTLMPGDVISTGTPSGVGLGFKPPKYLKHGDVVEVEISGLGKGTQRLVAYEGLAAHQ
jgi:2,4-diketo-3-deoxy-L-fuconate hydrolase